jgi:hypothetical protein
VVCRVRRDAATLDGTLRDEAEASLSLPTIESEMYSSMGGSWRRLHVCHVADLVAVLVLIAQRCRAPVDALAVLQNKM